MELRCISHSNKGVLLLRTIVRKVILIATVVIVILCRAAEVYLFSKHLFTSDIVQDNVVGHTLIWLKLTQ